MEYTGELELKLQQKMKIFSTQLGLRWGVGAPAPTKLKIFSTQLGLCSPRGSSLPPCSWEVNSNIIGGDGTQMTLIYRIFADFFYGIQLGVGAPTLTKNEK